MQNEKLLNLNFNKTRGEIKLLASYKFYYQAIQL